MKFLCTFLLSAALFQAPQVEACWKCALTFSDPHIRTFQQTTYQCQGEGDFIMAKSLTSDFELQARFKTPNVPLTGGRDGSVTTGAVLSTGVGNEAKVELKVSEGPATSLHDCDIHYKINGEEATFNNFDVHDAENRFDFTRRTIDDHGVSYSYRDFMFLDSSTYLWAAKSYDSTFGCYMNLMLCVPCDFDETHDIIGLFGSPNKATFMDTEGTQVDVPNQNEYCADNWCVGHNENSLFDIPSEYNYCTADSTTDYGVLVETADDDVKKQCEGNVNCIIDTVLTGDQDIGLKTLEEEKEKGFIGDAPEPTESDMQEEDDSYTCAKAGVGSETAFARPDDGANCFLDDDTKNFNRWGWSLEIDGTQSGSYEYDVYAGAGQCDTSKGELVGKVMVSYDAQTKDCKGEYLSTGGYSLQEFQFYCGSEVYPRTTNAAKAETVAPGQYPCKHTETETTISDTCVVESVEPKNGVIHAIAHAVSCGKGEESAARSFNAPQKTASGSGDPHFKTWTGDKYDYHGECDLVLIDDPSFGNGLGLRLHIRTTRVKYFSFIERAALQIGDNVLEFDNDVDNFLINGKPVEPERHHHKTMLGDYWVRRDPDAVSVRLHDNGRGDKHRVKIDFHTRKNGFPAVIVDAGGSDVFKGSLGLLGEFETGRKLARDGVSEIDVDPQDAEAFALEWQVRDTDPMLFKEARFPQYPTTCTPPGKRLINRLGSQNMLMEAQEACAHWKQDVEDCIFDVMATRDVLVAEEGHIVHLE